VELTPARLRRRPWSLWRYAELLPLRSPQRAVSLGETVSPVLPLPALAAELGVGRLLLKDEGLLPTGSFKARGAAVGTSRFVELGGQELVLPTNGNAGAAWAAYGARAGVRVHVVIPREAPLMTRREAVAAGADVRVIDGLIGDAGRLAAELAREHGWFDASTFKEPYRLEGKKTLGFEIAEQLGWRLPEVVVYPTGGGVGLLGMWKAWRELRELGLLVSERLPRLVAAQAEGCAPVVKAFQAGAATTEACPQAATAAFGINVPSPLAGALILRDLRESGGCAVAVSEAAIAGERAAAFSREGVHLCPEGACALAAARELARSGWLRDAGTVLVVNTGSGLKYPL
jgi:threonine synthase